MLSDAKLSDSFWAEALNTAAYVINLSPVVALDGDVLTEFGLVRMFLMIILDSLGVKSLYMFLRMKGQSLMLKLGSVSSLVMVKMNLVIVSMILLRRNLLRF